MERRQPYFVHCWNVGGHRQPCLGGDGKALDGAPADLRQGSNLISDDQIDALGHQIFHRRSAATIMGEAKARVGGFLEEKSKDVLRASHPCSSRERLVG